MTNERHQQIYTAIFSAMISSGVSSLPLHVKSFCHSLGLELCPLSEIIKSTGLSKDDVFGLWGNKDGAIMQFEHQTKIAYNDSLSRGRMRFTICEEASHFILKHVEDSRFNVFNQKYDNRLYQRYEEEARIGAGLLLCQPQYFFKNMDMLTPSTVAYLCDISEPCAEVRCGVLTRFKASIMSNPLFRRLPQPEIRRQLNAHQIGDAS